MGNITYLDEWKKEKTNKLECKLPRGFDNIEEFLGYCVSHSQTMDAEFKISHANFLYELAGRSKLTIRSTNQVVPIYEPEMNDLLRIISKKRNPRTK